jgi:hypothetical protein
MAQAWRSPEYSNTNQQNSRKIQIPSLKTGSGILSEFHALRLTEPRSVSGRGSRFQGAVKETAGTGRGGKDK